ncbi:cytochrome P450 [Algimonas porphyrae]|uniref:Cytochrome P450 n=2 Tax=Algimonas porphyrae TaxID=1128113 RepID=A0ABQ5UXC7_9PROT|nr:cytochrome P450 [Algimonas porphyrae]
MSVAHKQATAQETNMATARHDYRFRPEPLWENGRFVPPTIVPIETAVSDWDWIDWLRYMRESSRNPLHGVTHMALTEFDEIATGMGAIFFTPTRPETVREAFVEKSGSLRHSKIRNAILKPALREGLLTAEGERWRQDRRALAPLFTPRHVNGYADGIRNSAGPHIARLLETDTIDFGAAMVDLTYQVLSDVMFSGELDGGRTANLREIDRFLSSMGRPDPLDFTRLPEWIPRPTRIGRMGIVKRMRRQVRELAESRLTRIADGAAVPDDLLSLILSIKGDDDRPFTMEQIEDQMITFIAAGHETTSRALTFLFYLLSQDDAARTRLETECDALDITRPAIEWAAALPFTYACFEEAMRLYPPAPFLSRELKQPETLGEHDLPTGSVVFGSLWALHRHRALWDQPDAFVPERFLPDVRDRIGRFQYLPFGLGPHICIGARFAQLEAIVLTALIARQFRLTLIGDHPWPIARVTIRPEKPLMMQIERRSQG